ncbi:hypothetical protein LD119_00704 [Mesoplasma sp. JKS002660]|uniref:hypothetical protein n=1 Tax=Mesoplasma whartonense TaxID=2878854 RepID=UPI002022ACC3|nr:hypothetical protein [Mesoplasma sp. JKS002660]MCL8213753.1 hypothetical protein [Mesoplasma sp. JKS002660]
MNSNKRRKYIQAAKRFVGKRCSVCFRYIPITSELLCDDCQINWKYTIKINWVIYHHGTYLLTIKFGYFENGEWWFDDSINIQLDRSVQTTKEAYYRIVNNPALLKNKVMVDTDPGLLKVKFPKYPKWVGVDAYEKPSF